MGLDSDLRSINVVVKTTLRPAQGQGKNEGYLVLTFFEKRSDRQADQVYKIYAKISKHNAGPAQVPKVKTN